MEIILKVGKSDEPEFRSHVFSESLLSSIISALLAVEDERKKLQNLLSRMIAIGDDEESEDVLFINRRLAESSETYNDLSQLYYFLSKAGHRDKGMDDEINMERVGN